MTQPRMLFSGATYFITRRVIRRHCLLRPDADITRLIKYVLSISARRYGIRVHAVCAMSTHMHIVLTDPQGTLPLFLNFFHRLLALGTKSLRKWEGSVWDHEPTSVVQLLTREAIVEKIAYTLANPVAAGLVRYAREWPGAKTLVEDIGKGSLRAKRPNLYFDPMNPEWSDEASLNIALPPMIAEEEADRFRSDIARIINAEEASARKKYPAKAILGAKRAAMISPEMRMTSAEPLLKRNPTFAVGRGNGEALRRAAHQVRAFRASYRVALNRWRAGGHDACFPPGTWWMRIFHNANVESGDPARSGFWL